MTDIQDIPNFRKGRLMNIAYALGLKDDGDAIKARLADDLPFTEDFVQPIQARLNAELAAADARIAAAEALAQQGGGP